MKRGEIQLPCPRCSHPSFYFNTIKGFGFCHRATCGWSPTREQFEEFMKAKGRRVTLDAPQAPQIDDPEPGAVTWPADVVPLLYEDGRAHCEVCEEAIGHIEQDRRVPRDRQYHFGLRSSENRIYIPILDAGELVNYVGRAKWWINSEAKRYQYASGVSTSQYIYTWDYFQPRAEMVLVENTFNALWLRPYGVTTNFGSHLSAEQLEKIRNSRLRRVLILWDEGAESKAEKAVTQLRSQGVRASYVRLEGQPDGHREECLAAVIRDGMTALQGGDPRPIHVGHKPCFR